MSVPMSPDDDSPVAVLVPEVTPQETAAYHDRLRKKQLKRAGSYAVAGGVFHLLSIVVSLFLLKLIVEGAAGRAVAWGEFFDAASAVGLMDVLVLGIALQVFLAALAFGGGAALFREFTPIAVPLIVIGIAGIVLSVLLFGGFMGAIGGGLMAAGGAAGRVKPTPPPYAPPPVFLPPARP